jgi:hypothetical protein
LVPASNAKKSENKKLRSQRPIIARNREKPANYRSYSTETLIWRRKIYDISPAAWEAIRDVLPLPSDRLLRLRFSEPRALIADALLNVDQMWDLIQLWEKANSGAIENRRLRVTVNENGEVGGLKDLQQLEEIDIFQQFLRVPSILWNLCKTTGKMR